MSPRVRTLTLLLSSLFLLRTSTLVPASDMTLAQREKFVLSAINRIRAEQGLSQLRLNSKLRAMARSHSSNMAESGHLSHTDSLGRNFKERIAGKLPERYCAGENVATNNFPDSARIAVEGWRHSPKHLKNILNDRFTETGIGVAVNSAGLVFFTQIFLGKE